MQFLTVSLVPERSFGVVRTWKSCARNASNALRGTGVNGNGAIIHYRAAEDTCSSADASSMLLLDSGGQVVDTT